MQASQSLEARIAGIEERIATACRAANRPRESVTLVAVSKRHPSSRIREAHSLGLRDFGENYGQEFRDKAAELAALPGVRWHFIGPLQRNKVRYVVGKASLIHTLDSVELAADLERRAAALGMQQAVLLQVNISGEASKSGVDERGLAPLLDAVCALPNLSCHGLMTMPPAQASAAELSRIFDQLRELLGQRRDRAGEHFRLLSMGMSEDFELAIAAGATHIRVGTSLFGERP